MSAFVSRWVRWPEPETSIQRTAKTDKTLSRVPSVPIQHTAKTAKSSFVSFGSALNGRSEPNGKRTRESDGPPDTGSKPTPEEVVEMSVDEFADAGLTLIVRSEALDCRVLFASDNVPDEAIEANGLPVYRAAELRKLAQLRPSPGTIRCLNEIKAVFGGTIEVGEHD